MSSEDMAARAVEHEAERILAEAAIARSRTEHMARRLFHALYDTGLLDLVGRDWVSADEEEFHFKSLDHRAVQRLIVALRDLAERAPAPAPQPGLGQMGFVFTPRELMPVGVSSLHLLGGVR